MGSSHSKSLAAACILAWCSNEVFDVNARSRNPILSRPAFVGVRSLNQNLGINQIQNIRGGDDSSSSTDASVLDPPPPPPAVDEDGQSLDDKVNAAMRKLGLSPPEDDEDADGECKDGVCPMPDANANETESGIQQKEEQSTTNAEQQIDPNELAAKMAEEFNVDSTLTMAAIGATSTFDGSTRKFHPEAAREMIQQELNMISNIPEDSDDVKQLESEGYDSFMCRRALAFAEGSMEDARAILIAEQLDAEEAAAEEEAARAAAQAEAANDDDDDEAAVLAQLRAEREAAEAKPAMVEVKSNFDPTIGGGAGAAPQNPTPSTPQGMPKPAAKEKVVFEATTAQIQELVLESDVPVLLDIHAEW